jgi:hypothetical protein
MLTRAEREFIKSLGPEGERIWADIAHWVVAHRTEESDRAVAILGCCLPRSFTTRPSRSFTGVT